MRVYFNASLAGKTNRLSVYKEIIAILRELGHEVIADHVIKRDSEAVNQQTKAEHSKDFQKARENIQKSDVMVVEGTHPSIGIGLLLGLALDMYKPVLILYLSMPHGLLIGDPNRLLTVVHYSEQQRKVLKDKIKSFMERSKNKLLKLRFNFMISHNQNDYLEWIAIRNRISKAEFIRNLVDEKITRDLEYEKSIDYKEADVE